MERERIQWVKKKTMTTAEGAAVREMRESWTWSLFLWHSLVLSGWLWSVMKRLEGKYIIRETLSTLGSSRCVKRVALAVIVDPFNAPMDSFQTIRIAYSPIHSFPIKNILRHTLLNSSFALYCFQINFVGSSFFLYSRRKKIARFP